MSMTAKKYKGFELAWNTSAMKIKMYSYIALICFLIFLLCFIILCTIFIGIKGTWLIFSYAMWSVVHAIIPIPASLFISEASKFGVSTIQSYVHSQLLLLLGLSAISAVSFRFAWPRFMAKIKKTAEEEAQERHVRGTEITSEEILGTLIKDKYPTNIRITENVSLPIESEKEHAFITGRTRTGKTVTFKNVIRQLKQNGGGKGIIYEFKSEDNSDNPDLITGDYTQEFYDKERDFIFNPFLKQCVGWNVFNEIRDIHDCTLVAESMIPRPETPAGSEAYFLDISRDVFTGILASLWARGDRDHRALINALTSSQDDIRDMLGETDLGKMFLNHLTEGAQGQTAGALSELNRFAKVFLHLRDTNGDFSFRKWVREGEGWIFIANRARFAQDLKPLLSLVLDLMCTEVLSMRDLRHDDTSRTYLFLDELPTLQKLPSLIRLLTLAGGKGWSVWLGAQDFGAMKSTYGQHIAGSIFNNTGTKLVLKVEDPDTAAFLSKALGDREIVRTNESSSAGLGENRDGESYSKQHDVNKAILESQIMNLETLHAFLKVKNFPVAKILIPFKI